jgi:tripartite-type tricarboxylate transporter receptor subunit TctC
MVRPAKPRLRIPTLLRLTAAGALISGVAIGGAVHAADFYAGKRIVFIVGYAAGSGYDVNARFIARNISRFIPGNPKVLVQNMPGAGTLNATNHVANLAEKDGTVVGFIARGMALEPLFGGKGVRFDPLKLNWIGSTSREVSVIAVRGDAGVNRIEDVRNKQVIVAGPAPGTDGVTYPNVLNNLIGTKFKVITGYRSGKAMALAVKRGEVQGRGSWSWASFRKEAMDDLKAGKLKVLLQMGVTCRWFSTMRKPVNTGGFSTSCWPVRRWPGHPSWLPTCRKNGWRFFARHIWTCLPTRRCGPRASGSVSMWIRFRAKRLRRC